MPTFARANRRRLGLASETPRRAREAFFENPLIEHRQLKEREHSRTDNPPITAPSPEDVGLQRRLRWRFARRAFRSEQEIVPRCGRNQLAFSHWHLSVLNSIIPTQSHLAS